MVLVDSGIALKFILRKISVLPIILAAASTLVGYVNGSIETKLTAGDGKKQIELAYPYIYEKGINYDEDLSAQEMMKRLGSVRIYWSSKPSEFNSSLYGPSLWSSIIPQIKSQTQFNEIKQRVRAKDQKVIDELNDTPAQLIQVYQSDKIGFRIHQDVSSNFGLSLTGRPTEDRTSWDQVVSKSGLNSKPGVAEVVNLLTKTGRKIRIKYVKNSLEQICLAYRDIQVDLAGTNFLLRDFHSIDYDQEKNMLNFHLRSNIKESCDGCVLTPPEFISKLNPPELDVQALVKKKYNQLIYYSEF